MNSVLAAAGMHGTRDACQESACVGRLAQSTRGFQGCSGIEAYYYGIIQSSFGQSAVVIIGERGLLPWRGKKQSIVLPVAGMEF